MGLGTAVLEEERFEVSERPVPGCQQGEMKRGHRGSAWKGDPRTQTLSLKTGLREGEKGQTHCPHLWGSQALLLSLDTTSSPPGPSPHSQVPTPSATDTAAQKPLARTLDLHQETANLSHFPHGAGRPGLTLLGPG